MATYDDLQGKMLFNDGEGLTYEDLNGISTRMERKFWEQSHLSGIEIGNVNMQYAGSKGVSLQLVGHNMLSSQSHVPFPLTGPVIFSSLTKASMNQAVGRGVLGQRWIAGLTGTDPDGISEKTIMRMMQDEEYDIGAGLVANSAPGAGNPRWDTVGFLMGFDEGDAQTRDLEDAVTRAKSTQSQDKEMLIDVSWEYVTGAQSATYTQATLSTNYVPLITFARPVGEGAAIDIDDVYYNAFPLRLGIEDISGKDAFWVGSTAWQRDTVGHGSVYKNGAGAGELYFVPRNVHAGCRIIGVGVCRTACDTDFDIELGRWEHSSTTGVPTFTSIVNVGGGAPISGSSGGFSGASDRDWSPSDTIRQPIWGNGMGAGPLWEPERSSYASARTSFNRFAIHIQDKATEDWADGDAIYFVRVIYLY